MKSTINIHLIWALMMLLTLGAYFIGESGSGGVVAMLFLMSAAGVKSVLIIRDFMELRGVSFLWRAIMYGWLIIVSLSIAIIYIISMYIHGA
jgi:hypothetical protein